MSEPETFRKIIEDTFLLASQIHAGEDLEETEHAREWRIMELVISIGERTARACGFDQDDLWIPSDLEDVVDVA